MNESQSPYQGQPGSTRSGSHDLFDLISGHSPLATLFWPLWSVKVLEESDHIPASLKSSCGALFLIVQFLLKEHLNREALPDHGHPSPETVHSLL